MRVSGKPRDLSRFLLVILISTIILYPGSNLSPAPQVVSPIIPVQASVPSSSFALNEWNVPTSGGGPWGIAIDAFGKIWFTENDTSKIASFDSINNNFTEWAVPGGGNPRYIATKNFIYGGKNVTRVYFTEYTSNKIAYFNSWNGTFYEWQLPAGSNPMGIFVESNSTSPTDGNFRIWFTESGRDVIGLLAPATNQLTEWTLPGATSTPGTPLLEPWGISVQSILSGIYHNETDRYVYFTELMNNAVGRLQVRTPQNLLLLWDLNSVGNIPGLQYGPMDIFVDSTSPGNVLFTAAYGDRISVLQNCGSTCSGYTEYVLPSRTSIAKPSSIRIDQSHGLMWFTEYNSGVVAGLDATNSGTPSFVPKSSQCVIPPTIAPACASPSGYSLTTVTPKVTNNVLGTVTNGVSQASSINLYQGPINGIYEYRLASPVARPTYLSLDSVGNVWFTENNVTVNRIGRFSIPYVFQLAVSPNVQTIQQGQSTGFNVMVTVSNGIPSSVQLQLVNTPQGLSAGFNPPTGTPQQGAPFTSTLTILTTNSTTPGTYVMNVTASSAGQIHSFQISLVVGGPAPPPTFDYAIDVVNGNTVTVQQGLTGSFQFQTTSIGGVPLQAVNLTVSGLPGGITVSQFANPNGIPTFSSVLTLQTSLTLPAGSYDLTNSITGKSTGGLQHHPRETVTLVVTAVPRDFSLAVSSSSVNVVQAARVDLTVSISPVGPFVGNVSLTGAFSPSDPGLTVTFSPSTVSILSNGGNAQATLEIIAQRTTPGRTYQLTVTATSNSAKSHQITLSVRVSPCLIATATFGSELAPEVQFLRDFRDQQVLTTFAGSNFMSVFNAWYYSFSPNVAEFESSHTSSREVMQVLLYPLIFILHGSSDVYSVLQFQPELGVLAGGIMASLLLGFTYLSIPLVSLFLICRKRLNSKIEIGRWVVLVVISLITCYGLSEVMQNSYLMMFASSGLVIASALAGGILATSIVSKLARRLC